MDIDYNNKIEVDFTNLSKQSQTFVKNTIQNANKNGVSVHLLDERLVSGCNGFFSTNGKSAELSVACAQSSENWLRIFLHESCHMDQYLEHTPLWHNMGVGEDNVEANDILHLWVQECVELTQKQLWDYICRVRTVELDCEIRSVNKIKQFNLPIDVDEYTQKANSYIWFYTVLGFTRKWYSANKEPYNVPELWTKLPTHFDNDYGMIPESVKDLYFSLVQ